ncbi:saccharopine dehydrogenase [Sediminicola sp. YIK13]|uniref:saccharopine dehydrogenase family protein n=1 Tax=Sediminicola sp. YIK13 TaxID=1453352 RepID=UPI000720D88D|nr:saccharopine dehydrogenase C-terminal domain-containing protein [Sediminicola sp. YIK13]ALM07407.1 saccharopine dehydrogenase [Sediminicola sp. YIK13]
MKAHYNIIIAGAGGIAEAAGLILAEWSTVSPTIYIGNRTLEKAQRVSEWIKVGTTKSCEVVPFLLDAHTITDEMKRIFEKGDALLDCLPGSLAPKMAQFAKDFGLYYANLTEYVAETDQIIKLAKNADSGFVLQTGLAPGYINVSANHLFQEFCRDFEVEAVDTLEFKVGALTINAVAPHYYGFTWSPIGVATEYVKDAIAIRDFEKVSLPALSESKVIIINGTAFEEDLTSGGAADLPDALKGKVRSLDYKTLRHPGHYAWVADQLSKIDPKINPIQKLQRIMLDSIPHVEDDQIVLYAAVQGNDSKGTLRRRETSKIIYPQKVGHHELRAIQTTTAVPLIQSIQWLLENRSKGITLQSTLSPKEFLNGAYIVPVYGNV